MRCKVYLDVEEGTLSEGGPLEHEREHLSHIQGVLEGYRTRKR
jgi:hypothetical protein